jgi:hypothetical protein
MHQHVSSCSEDFGVHLGILNDTPVRREIAALVNRPKGMDEECIKVKKIPVYSAGDK